MNPLLHETHRNTRDWLLAGRNARGFWEGELSSSALSTATAVLALALVGRERHRGLIRRGLDWLAVHANEDGGWGDTILSRSNISTTTLAWAAFGLLGETAPAAEAWLVREAGSVQPERLAETLVARYGKDRTFSVPILTACALAGRLGDGREAWRHVLPLPFELSVLPPDWFKWARLPVVSYALPALIAIGLVRHHHLPPGNPLTRFIRDRARRKSLRVLGRIQPSGGGFLEAAPLTSFVAMSMAGMGLADHPVTVRCVHFLVGSVRADGSWPIDTNLATWLTTLSVNALGRSLPEPERAAIRGWLLAQQHREVHPFTNAAPGGWAWTDLSGGVPDADDTAGALLALRQLGACDEALRQAGANGIRWLLDLQNRDGGVPTFCRGWGLMPFDRSSPDLTAHALRAFAGWRDLLPAHLGRRAAAASRRAVRFLGDHQRGDGAWSPLWFGNQHAPDGENLTYGTAQVLLGLQAVSSELTTRMERRAAAWLVSAQNDDGSWGGGVRTLPSIEETALAVRALAADASARDSVSRGVDWLVEKTAAGREFTSAPIGLYFARLWYFEKLSPAIHLAAALERLAREDGGSAGPDAACPE